MGVTENVVPHLKSGFRSRRSSSPSPVKKERMKERSLSPGTKEIRAYWAEQEEKKKKKKSKKIKDKERDENIDMFAEIEVEKKRHASGSSIDSIEKLRLQALETLKSRAQQHQEKTLYDDSDDDQVYVEKRTKKSRKKKSKKSKSSDDSEEDSRRRKKKKHKRHSSDSSDDSDNSSHSNTDLKKAWEEIKSKWEKKLKRKKVSDSE